MMVSSMTRNTCCKRLAMVCAVMVLAWSAAVAGQDKTAAAGFDLLIPKPHEVVLSPGGCTLPASLGVENEFKDRRLDLQLVRTFPGRAMSSGDFLKIRKTAMTHGDEAYELIIDSSGIQIAASAPSGVFHALKTLEQLARGGATVSCGTVRDWPSMPFRGVHLMACGLFTPSVEMLRTFVEEMADLKFNKLVLECNERFPWKSSVTSTYTVEDLRSLVKLAEDNFIEVIPLVNSLGHMEHLLRPESAAHVREQPENIGEMCPQNPESLKFIKEMWGQVLPVFPESAYANITGDEVFRVKPCPKCQPFDAEGRRGELYSRYYTELSRWMLGQGKTPLMWGDMIIKHPESLAGLSRDSIICDWNYSGPEGNLFSPYYEYNPKGVCDETRRKLLSPYWRPDQQGGYTPFPYLEFFGDHGFKTVACTAADHQTGAPHCVSKITYFNNMGFALEAERQSKSCLGLLITSWGTQPIPAFWFGIAAGGDFSWNCRKEEFPRFVNRFAAGFLGRPDWTEPILRLAEAADWQGYATPAFEGEAGPGATPMAREVGKLLRFAGKYNAFVQARRASTEKTFRSNAAGTPESLDLGKIANHSIKDVLPPKARRLTTSSGDHSYAGIPFKLDGERVISLSSKKAEAVKLPLERKVTGLVFWDTAYNAFAGKAIATMKVNYADQSRATFDFVGGENVIDWTGYARKPKDKLSCVAAWRGRKDTSEPLVSWLTYWRNPSPDIPVASIELSATPCEDVDAHFVILGLTALSGGQGAPSAETVQPQDSSAELKQLAGELYGKWLLKQSYGKTAVEMLFAP